MATPPWISQGCHNSLITLFFPNNCISAEELYAIAWEGRLYAGVISWHPIVIPPVPPMTI